MKKLVTLALVCVLGLSALGFTACAAEPVKVKVLDEILLTKESYAFAVKKGDTETKESIDAFMTKIEEDGTLDSIINEFFDGTSDFTYTNPSSSKDCLMIATSADFPPFEYKAGNAFTGVDIKIAKLYADSLGKTLYVDDIGFDQVILAMGQDSNDYVLGMAGITKNKEREKSMDFSKEYYESAQVIIVKESDTAFDDCKTAADVEAVLKAQPKKYKVGTQKGTTGYMYSNGDEGFGYEGFGNLKTVQYDAGALAVKDLSNGKINAVIIDLQPALMIAKSVNATIE